MSITLQGTIIGRTIQLDQSPGLADGSQVQVVVSVTGSKTAATGEGIRRSAGAAADLPGVDEALAQVQRDRESAAHREVAP